MDKETATVKGIHRSHPKTGRVRAVEVQCATFPIRVLQLSHREHGSPKQQPCAIEPIRAIRSAMGQQGTRIALWLEILMREENPLRIGRHGIEEGVVPDRNRNVLLRIVKGDERRASQIRIPSQATRETFPVPNDADDRQSGRLATPPPPRRRAVLSHVGKRRNHQRGERSRRAIKRRSKSARMVSSRSLKQSRFGARARLRELSAIVTILARSVRRTMANASGMSVSRCRKRAK